MSSMRLICSIDLNHAPQDSRPRHLNKFPYITRFDLRKSGDFAQVLTLIFPLGLRQNDMVGMAEALSRASKRKSRAILSFVTTLISERRST